MRAFFDLVGIQMPTANLYALVGDKPFATVNESISSNEIL